MKKNEATSPMNKQSESLVKYAKKLDSLNRIYGVVPIPTKLDVDSGKEQK